jgi:hypothetical protein
MDPALDIPTGSHLLAPGGQIWTVRRITAERERFVLTSASTSGERGIVVDAVALLRMVRIDGAPRGTGDALVPRRRPRRPGPPRVRTATRRAADA